MKNNERSVLIDSLRGIAAFWVMLFHFYYALIGDKNGQLYADPLDAFFKAGHMGVYIFFVLSGYVISLSLMSKDMTIAFFSRFLLRRSIRLDIPYWAVIVMTGISVYLMDRFGLSRREPFGIYEYVTNMLYLDNLVGSESIVSVGWTLQYEIQFYLFFALLLFLCNRFTFDYSKIFYIFLFTFIVSQLYWFSWFPLHVKGLFLDFWIYFLLGVFTQLTVNRQLSMKHYGVVIALCLIHYFIFPDTITIIAVVTSALLLYGGLTNRMGSLLNWRPLVFLGSISYSLYLLHPFLGNRIIRFITYKTRLTPGSATLIFMGMIAVTVLFAWLFYKIIELPSHKLSRKIDLQPSKREANYPKTI